MPEMNKELLEHYMEMVNYKVRAVRENKWIDVFSQMLSTCS